MTKSSPSPCRAQLPAQHCFEFRHPSWFADDAYALLEESGANLALGDDKRRELPDWSSPISTTTGKASRRATP